jgi:hypothetical protein
MEGYLGNDLVVIIDVLLPDGDEHLLVEWQDALLTLVH